VAYAPDDRLHDTAWRAVAPAAGQRGVKLKQSYVRLGKKALVVHARTRHRGEKKLAKKQLRKLRTYLGRVVRDFERKLAERSPKTVRLLEIVAKILNQKTTSKHKIYSVHAPEVVCLAKGKARVKYEFGSKFLLGVRGDQINAVMAGCGFNMRKLWRAFFLPIFTALIELVLAPRRELCPT
jgi:IS5 family transposase